MTYKIEMNKRKRNEFKVYWGGAKTSDVLHVIGKNIEDMPVELNSETAESNDILGNATFEVLNYKPSMTVDPVHVRGEDEYALFLHDIIFYQKTGDDLETSYVLSYEYFRDEKGNSRAIKKKAVVNPQSFAGGLDGITMPHEVRFVKNDEDIFGHIDIKTGEFVEGDASTPASTTKTIKNNDMLILEK